MRVNLNQEFSITEAREDIRGDAGFKVCLFVCFKGKPFSHNSPGGFLSSRRVSRELFGKK
jgi:hypothetical protein